MVPAKNRPAGSTAPSLKRFSSAEADTGTSMGMTCFGILEDVGGNGSDVGGIMTKPKSAVAKN
jgi:hypothetical protein